MYYKYNFYYPHHYIAEFASEGDSSGSFFSRFFRAVKKQVKEGLARDAKYNPLRKSLPKVLPFSNPRTPAPPPPVSESEKIRREVIDFAENVSKGSRDFVDANEDLANLIIKQMQDSIRQEEERRKMVLEIIDKTKNLDDLGDSAIALIPSGEDVINSVSQNSTIIRKGRIPMDKQPIYEQLEFDFGDLFPKKTPKPKNKLLWPLLLGGGGLLGLGGLGAYLLAKSREKRKNDLRRLYGYE